MRVAFVFQSFENLGVEALSAALTRAGHETALFFDPKLFDDTFYHNGFLSNLFDVRTKVIRDLVGWEPDVVAFSVLSDLYPWATNMARSIKEVYKAPIIFGGIHPTSVPDIVIQDQNVDYVVQGEGDETIVELVDYIADGASPADLPNVWSKVNGEIKGNPPRPLIRDLDSLPFPDKALYDHTFVKGTRIYTIMASRGCPHKCTYCNAALLKELYCEEKGSHWRARSVDNVIEELEWAQSENRVGIINKLLRRNFRREHQVDEGVRSPLQARDRQTVHFLRPSRALHRGIRGTVERSRLHQGGPRRSVDRSDNPKGSAETE